VRVRRADEAAVEAARAEARGEERLAETRTMVSAEVAREGLRIASGGREDEALLANLPDDRDGGVDDAVQFTLWKVREIKRIKREHQAAAARAAM
jgi:hypothetical protein